jgi:uncharacterized protein with PQ loop repeat
LNKTPKGDKIMELSQVLSWVGTATGMFVGVPQLVKTVRTKKTSDLSATTFILILMTCACLLVRAIAIREAAFILYYTFLILINSLQLFLIWKYKGRDVPA